MTAVVAIIASYSPVAGLGASLPLVGGMTYKQLSTSGSGDSTPVAAQSRRSGGGVARGRRLLGSGETTLMNIIGCMDTPTKGTVCDGRELGRLNASQLTIIPQERHRTGLPAVPSHPAPRPSRTSPVAQYYHSMTGEEAMEALENVELGTAKSPASQLSGGEQQRVCIARPHQPSEMSRDETTGNLDEGQ